MLNSPAPADAVRTSIPTLWRGVQFRSRLEARWAALFDHLGWPWHYEPFDLEGYIPDFVLPFSRLSRAGRDVLVEVKPFVGVDEPIVEVTAQRIRATSWGLRPALIVGAAPHGRPELFVGAFSTSGWGVNTDTTAFVSRCGQNEGDKEVGTHYCLDRLDGLWQCQVCGARKNYGDCEPRPVAEDHWIAAGNGVQWRAPRR